MQIVFNFSLSAGSVDKVYASWREADSQLPSRIATDLSTLNGVGDVRRLTAFFLPF